MDTRLGRGDKDRDSRLRGGGKGIWSYLHLAWRWKHVSLMCRLDVPILLFGVPYSRRGLWCRYMEFSSSI